MLPAMETISLYTLGILAATGACLMGILYICAVSIRDETALHDVKVEARKMRIEFDRRVSARNAGKHADEQEPIDEEPFMEV